MSANVYSHRTAQVLLRSLAFDLQDVQILSGATAGAVGPASLWVGAGLRANI